MAAVAELEDTNAVGIFVQEGNGKQITLFSLATHTAGLPRDPSNLTPARGLPENAFADHTVEKLYAFLSSFALDREPGSTFEYSNVGMALPGHMNRGEGYPPRTKP